MDSEPSTKDLQKTLDDIDEQRDLLEAQVQSLQLQKEDLDEQRIQILTQMQSLMKSNRVNNKKRTKNTSYSNDLRLVQFSGEFKWDQAVSDSLHNIFKIGSFREQQREIINCTLKE
eukprot:280797_1